MSIWWIGWDPTSVEEALGTLLVEEWGLRDAVATPLDGGMNSLTWTVRAPGASYVAKWVRREGTDLLAAGATAARLAARSGVLTGAPVPRRGGSDLAALGEGVVALLEHVPGAELDGENDEDAAAMGDVLARVHRATRGQAAAGALRWHWVEPHRLDADPPLRAVVADVVRQVDRLGALVHGVCHGDPAPEAFLRSEHGVGLIDWGSVVDGPLLYDVASAVMYLGGPAYAAPLLHAYAAHDGPATADLDYVDLLLRMRWAVQADYFAGRLASDDLTGVEDGSDNQRGYDRARSALLVDLS
ncbi:unannotated protein [freshwater metagenome]|uniref:Unannotated protein n=1 Tax=freshwater metagenome TaxID=449393 RepID=A0A6J6VF58_9ZZZZ|nr:phosphotransferase [Actinomycetota bacterium]